MTTHRLRRKFFTTKFQGVMAILCTSTLVSLGQPASPAPQSQTMTTTTPATEEAPKIPNDQLDSLVAPIALYPDPLVAQVLAASTYPLEIVQLEQWMTNNKALKDKALEDAVANQPWDPSVQSLAAFPDVLKQLSEHVSWTMDLGNAFLAQQADVMDAIQRMRAKAQGNGNLKTSAQQTVETQTVDNKQVIVIQPADPQVVYVPQYSPAVVYGAPAYPYPYVYPPGYGLLAFGAGVAIGAAWGGSWGNCNWHGGGNVTINNNNNFNRNNINNGNRNQISNRPGQGGGGTQWQHNPSHRGGAPYSNKVTTNQYARGTTATAQTARGGAAAGVSTKNGNTAVGQTAGGKNYAVHNGNVYTGGGNASKSGASGGGNAGASRTSGGAGVSTRPAGGSSFGGGDRVGNRSVSGGGGFGSSSSAFGGGGFGGNSARSASSRGGSSMGGGGFSRGGGGGGFGGGGRGGGGRGGGGGGRR